MAYDEELADRVRGILGGRTEAEKRMFGGLSFMVDGRLAVAVSGRGGLLVKVGKADHAALLARDHVEPMTMGGRSSATWLHVLPPALESEDALEEWVDRGLADT